MPNAESVQAPGGISRLRSQIEVESSYGSVVSVSSTVFNLGVCRLTGVLGLLGGLGCLGPAYWGVVDDTYVLVYVCMYA